MTDHLLSECLEASKLGGYRRCERCTEAVPNVSFITHNSCKMASNPALRCPLCHTNLPETSANEVGLTIVGGNYEDAWRNHLLRECKQNSRISNPPPSNPTTEGEFSFYYAEKLILCFKRSIQNQSNQRSYSVNFGLLTLSRFIFVLHI